LGLFLTGKRGNLNFNREMRDEGGGDFEGQAGERSINRGGVGTRLEESYIGKKKSAQSGGT